MPLIVGGVIEGRVLLDAPSAPPVGRPIPVLLVEVGSGTRTLIESFSDGRFTGWVFRLGTAHHGALRRTVRGRSRFLGGVARTHNAGVAGSSPAPAIA